MSFLDDGKPDPEWEEWMDDPVSREAGWSCFGWALIAAGIVAAVFVIAFIASWIAYFNRLNGEAGL